MKLVTEKISLCIRLSAIFAALLLGQQAMAEGTPAGEVVDNTASVAYDIGLVTQTAVPSNTVSFVVDRRVAFTVGEVGTALVPITPLDSDVFFDLLLTNTSNSALDFHLAINQLVATVRSVPDTTDMVDAEFAVWTDSVANSGVAPAQGTAQFVDDLAADDAIMIRVWGDAATTMTDGQVAGIELVATAHEPGAAGLGVILVDTTNDPGLVDNVFADDLPALLPSGDGVEAFTDGFIVNAANLSVVKSFVIVDGDLGSGKLIPGTRIEYMIVISNSATISTAENVVITDGLDDDLAFLTGGVGGSAYTDINVDDGINPAVDCTASDGDADGCSFDSGGSGDIVVGGVGRDIDIAAGGSYTVKFQVRIPDPATTPPPSP